MKSIKGTQLTSSITTGNRLILCTTNEYTTGTVKHTGIFFAIYNTAYNLTEYVFEDPVTDDEVFRDVQVNEELGMVLIISEYDNETKIRIRNFLLTSKFY